MTVCKKDDASEEYVFIASKGVYLSLDVCHSRKALKCLLQSIYLLLDLLYHKFCISYCIENDFAQYFAKCCNL